MKIKQKYGELTDCTELRATNSLYPIWKAAALWCGVEEENIDEVQSEMEHVAKTIFKHNAIPCLEVRARILSEAIERKEIGLYREYGGAKPVAKDDNVAYDRQHIKGVELRDWISKHYPNDKPSFLFTEAERNLHTGIKKDDYLAVVAERNELEKRLEKAKDVYREQQQQIKKLTSQEDKKPSPKTINKQNEIIAALTLVYLKGSYQGNANKGHSEAAKTLIQAFDLELPQYGIKKKIADVGKLSEYINEGVSRLKE